MRDVEVVLTQSDQNFLHPSLRPTQICTHKVPPHQGEGIVSQTTWKGIGPTLRNMQLETTNKY